MSHICPERAGMRTGSIISELGGRHISSHDILLLKRAQTRFELRAGEAVGEIQRPFSYLRNAVGDDRILCRGGIHVAGRIQ